ncbi:unnamed protein product [Meganyctiphanes norvegica]|uniref:Uncharacterized protein n=1 Tax=Meganyctiphanes norvegica TaxID=48144 RepID=A0AAV2PRM1_MEGNR
MDENTLKRKPSETSELTASNGFQSNFLNDSSKLSYQNKQQIKNDSVIKNRSYLIENILKDSNSKKDILDNKNNKNVFFSIENILQRSSRDQNNSCGKEPTILIKVISGDYKHLIDYELSTNNFKNRPQTNTALKDTLQNSTLENRTEDIRLSDDTSSYSDLNQTLELKFKNAKFIAKRYKSHTPKDIHIVPESVSIESLEFNNAKPIVSKDESYISKYIRTAPENISNEDIKRLVPTFHDGRALTQSQIEGLIEAMEGSTKRTKIKHPYYKKKFKRENIQINKALQTCPTPGCDGTGNIYKEYTNHKTLNRCPRKKVMYSKPKVDENYFILIQIPQIKMIFHHQLRRLYINIHLWVTLFPIENPKIRKNLNTY